MHAVSARVCQFLLVVVAVLSQASAQTPGPLPGMPPVQDPKDIYAADRPGNLSPVVRDYPSRVYVPNTESDTVSVIDPATYKVTATLKVGRQPQHVTPSWDLKTLWVLNDMGNSLTAIDPITGKLGRTVPGDDPYNRYYTPDGEYGIVVYEAKQRHMNREAATTKPVN